MNEDHHPVGRPMAIDRAELRKRAEAATKGGWDWGTFGNEVGILADDDLPFCRMRVSEETYDQRLDDAQFIVATQPSTVLALLDRIEELEGALSPFAAFADGIEHFSGWSRPGTYAYESSIVGSRSITEDDFRRARKALSGAQS